MAMTSKERSAAARKAIATMRREHGANYFSRLSKKAAQTRVANERKSR
jgi:hypothetical protein